MQPSSSNSSIKKRIVRNLLVLCMVMVAFVSCEKENSEVANLSSEALLYTWSRVDEIPSGLSQTDFRYFDMKTA